MTKIVLSDKQLPTGLDDHERFEIWRARFGEMFGGEIDFGRSEAPFAVESTFVVLNDVVVGQSSGTIVRSDHGGARSRPASAGRTGILINTGTAPLHSVHRDREQVVAPGDAVLLAHEDAGSLTANHHDNAWLMLDLPERTLLRATQGMQDQVGALLGGGSESMRLLSGYTNLLCRQDGVTDPLIAAHMAGTLVDLVTLTLRPLRDSAELARERGLQNARLGTVLQQISASYRDPSFTIGDVAAKLRLSPRTIQDLLQTTGMGFSDRVTELRLMHAARLLARPGQGRRKISDVAYECGFNDLSYFHRCFRRRFGMTPGLAKAA